MEEDFLVQREVNRTGKQAHELDTIPEDAAVAAEPAQVQQHPACYGTACSL